MWCRRPKRPRDRLTPLLHLDSTWRFPVHIRVVMPDDPLADKVHQSGVEVTASGNTMAVESGGAFDRSRRA